MKSHAPALIRILDRRIAGVFVVDVIQDNRGTLVHSRCEPLRIARFTTPCAACRIDGCALRPAHLAANIAHTLHLWCRRELNAPHAHPKTWQPWSATRIWAWTHPPGCSGPCGDGAHRTVPAVAAAGCKAKPCYGGTRAFAELIGRSGHSPRILESLRRFACCEVPRLPGKRRIRRLRACRAMDRLSTMHQGVILGKVQRGDQYSRPSDPIAATTFGLRPLRHTSRHAACPERTSHQRRLTVAKSRSTTHIRMNRNLSCRKARQPKPARHGPQRHTTAYLNAVSDTGLQSPCCSYPVRAWA